MSLACRPTATSSSSGEADTFNWEGVTGLDEEGMRGSSRVAGRDMLLSTGGASAKVSSTGSEACVNEDGGSGPESEGTSAVLSWSSVAAGVKGFEAKSCWMRDGGSG